MLLKNNDIVIIGVPFRSGCNREGAQYAPIWLKENALSFQGTLQMLHFPSEDIPLTDVQTYGIRNYNAVCQMKNELKVCVNEAISNEKKVVTIGGDHSIAIGSIAGVLHYYPNLGVIWFDAHLDINTEVTSPSGNAHGMPLAALMGLWKSEINNHGNTLASQNVYWVGARDIDTGEWETIKRLGIESHVFTIEKVHQLGMEGVMHHIRTSLAENGVKQLHLSFDIDGMDPTIAPATGTPVINGLTDVDFNAFVDELSEGMPQLVSMDFVEYNPLMDNEKYSTGEWCTNALAKLMNKMSKQ